VSYDDMSPFSESFQKELGKGIAQLLLGVATVLFLLAAGLLQGDKRTASTVLLYLGLASSLVLSVSLLFRLFSFRRIQRTVAIIFSRALPNLRTEQGTGVIEEGCA